MDVFFWGILLILLWVKVFGEERRKRIGVCKVVGEVVYFIFLLEFGRLSLIRD